ncbi:N-formylglutamate amidohydrolase [Streptomyces aurantiacus]|uniref:N-formylglutamate amidohydrolase n=1 Tax=Streptomyces aurantiacus TaxID=47760 RepID=UPI0027925C21|nr:N-formylglutamate amidohydrolase [Streptomyces aurantiacus]MDQ0773282.1 N-formylglutamate amidohydrolase [Streptomyces aurantiacus]
MKGTSAVYRLMPGATGSPVILHVPHSSRTVPADARSTIVLDDAALERELDHITDSHTARIAAEAAARSTEEPWRFVNQLSRLVVDPERFPDEREEMRTVGMGAVYTRTTHGEPLRPEHTPSTDALSADVPDSEGLGADAEQLLLDRYFHPYAAAMTDAVTQRLAAVGRAVVIDVHSYPSERLPYELHGDGPRPPVCLGHDPFHTPPDLLAHAEKAFAGFGGTGINSPFAGTYVPLKHYGNDRRVSALMIEIRRDVYMTEPGGPAGPGLDRVAAALAELVDAVTGA